MERERENHFSSTKTYRILSSPQTCAGRRNVKTETNYNQHDGLGKKKYIPRHVDYRRLLNAAIGASVFARGKKMRSEVVERRSKRRRNTQKGTRRTQVTLSVSHTHKTRLLAMDEICTQDYTLCCGWNLRTRLHSVQWMKSAHKTTLCAVDEWNLAHKLHLSLIWMRSAWNLGPFKSGGCDLWTSFNLDECWMLDVPNDLVHWKMCLLLEKWNDVGFLKCSSNYIIHHAFKVEFGWMLVLVHMKLPSL
jgi:hypothetical protein